MFILLSTRTFKKKESLSHDRLSKRIPNNISLKLYSISKLVFGTVILLIILLPVSRHWRLLSTGVRTEGIVQDYLRHVDLDMFGEHKRTWASELNFLVGDSLFVTLGPVDHEMEKGKTIMVYYNPRDPSKNCLFNFVSFYYTNYSILPLILLVVWYAFYLSYNNYRREKPGKSHTPASSPYTPFRRSKPKDKPGNKSKEDPTRIS